MLQQHELHILFRELGFRQRAHEEDVRIGAARHRDALALQIGHRLDRVGLGDKRRPFRPGIDADALHRIAIDAGDERSRTGGRAEIQRAGIEKFQRLVGAQRLDPADGDAILLELLLDQAAILDEQADRIVGRVVDADFGQFGCGLGQRRRAGDSKGGGGDGQNRAAGKLKMVMGPSVDAAGPAPRWGAPPSRALRFSCICRRLSGTVPASPIAPASCVLRACPEAGVDQIGACSFIERSVRPVNTSFFYSNETM